MTAQLPSSVLEHETSTRIESDPYPPERLGGGAMLYPQKVSGVAGGVFQLHEHVGAHGVHRNDMGRRSIRAAAV
jgi:hypothetical protein